MRVQFVLLLCFVGIVSGCAPWQQDPGSSVQGSSQQENESEVPADAYPTELDNAAAAWMAKSSQHYVVQGWQKVPPWADNLPFDLKSLLAIPPEENREAAWIQAHFELGPRSYVRNFPQLNSETPEWLRPFMKLQSARIGRINDFCSEHVSNEQPPAKKLTAKELETAKNLLAPFQQVLKEMDSVLETPHCHFHSTWEIGDSSRPIYEMSNTIDLLTLRLQTQWPAPESIRTVEIGLQLHRDLAVLPMLVDQLSLNLSEQKIFNNMVHFILADEGLKVETLDRLISILKRHQSESWQTDPFVEVTRREILDLRHLFHQLAHQEFATPERAKDLGLEPRATPVEMLIRQVDDFGFFGINDRVVKEELSRIVASDQKMQTILGRIGSDEKANSAAAKMILEKFIPLNLNSLEPSDLVPDTEVLNTRYQQVLKATSLPFPESSSQLKALEENWTLDKSWRKAEVLKWFAPQTRATRVRINAHNRIGAYLCLAAVRKWQLDHPEGATADFPKALKAIGIEQVPIDAYSGNPLNFFETPTEYCVYSIGPDGIDDNAKKEYDPYSKSDNFGDVTFRLSKQ